MKTNQTLNLTLTGSLGIVGGIWLLIAPFLLNYKDTAAANLQTNANNATILSLIAGAVAIVLAGFAVATERMPQLRPYRYIAGFALLALGLVLMAAPYLFNYAVLRNPLWSLQITGGIFALIAGFVMQELFKTETEQVQLQTN